MNLNKIVLGDYIDVLTDYHSNGAYAKLKENEYWKNEPLGVALRIWQITNLN